MIKDNTIVCIVGLGYVGYPLAKSFSKKFKTIGFDIDDGKIADLKENGDNGISFTQDPSSIHEADFVIIAVPTPLKKSKEPNLSFIKSAAETVGKNLKKGATVVLESTVYPGVTEDIMAPILEKESGMKCGTDFKVGYSPERVNPGDEEHSIDKITKIVSGIDKETLEDLDALYGTITTTFKAHNIKTAEAAKVIENIQRDLNIALINELTLIFHKMGINTQAVLEAASTKWNFHNYKPGLVGGHCLPLPSPQIKRTRIPPTSHTSRKIRKRLNAKIRSRHGHKRTKRSRKSHKKLQNPNNGPNLQRKRPRHKRITRPRNNKRTKRIQHQNLRMRPILKRQQHKKI